MNRPRGLRVFKTRLRHASIKSWALAGLCVFLSVAALTTDLTLGTSKAAAEPMTAAKLRALPSDAPPTPALQVPKGDPSNLPPTKTHPASPAKNPAPFDPVN